MLVPLARPIGANERRSVVVAVQFSMPVPLARPIGANDGGLVAIAVIQYVGYVRVHSNYTASSDITRCTRINYGVKKRCVRDVRGFVHVHLVHGQ